MEELSKELLEAIARAKQQVAGEIQDQKDEGEELQDAIGGVQEPLWQISISYST